MNKFEAFQLLGLSGQITNDDIKKAYRKKAQQYHPDRNPAGAEIMKMINVAYELVKNETSADVFENEAMRDHPEKISAALKIVIDLALDVEVCGTWVWVSGDTRPHKEILKQNGFRWSPKKAMWYYRPESDKSRKYFSRDKSEWDISKIRETFGSSRPTRQSNKLEKHG